MVGYSIKRIYSTALLAITMAPLLLTCSEASPFDGLDKLDDDAMQGSSSTAGSSSAQQELPDYYDDDEITVAKALLEFRNISKVAQKDYRKRYEKLLNLAKKNEERIKIAEIKFVQDRLREATENRREYERARKERYRKKVREARQVAFARAVSTPQTNKMQINYLLN
ncbi:MAG: hypothetical protein K2X90_01295 [Candidatus Babeliaceae bacterium]|nr:hypothetical protein [Candidatus Babeliaceae bacterium]